MSKTLSKSQQAFVDKVINALDKGRSPWKMQWNKEMYSNYNGITQNCYRGMNAVILEVFREMDGYQDPRWYTFNQAKNIGAKVKKGESGIPLSFFTVRNIETKEEISLTKYNKLPSEEKKDYRFIEKSFFVFNGDQIENLPELDIELNKIEFKNELAKNVSDDYLTSQELEIIEKSQAAYDMDADKIKMPDKKHFYSEEGYYSTLFHEIAHSTLHEKRLNREVKAYLKESRVIEELRAEITSSLLQYDLGFKGREINEENHITYIRGWLSHIKDNPNVLFDSIADAMGIREFILDKGNYEKHLENTMKEELEEEFERE